MSTLEISRLERLCEILRSEAGMLREERDALKRRVDELETLLDQAEETNAARPYGRGQG